MAGDDTQLSVVEAGIAPAHEKAARHSAEGRAPRPEIWEASRALLESDRIAATDGARARDAGVDADVDLVVPSRCAQDSRILRKVSLGQRRHHAAGTWAADIQANLASNADRTAHPGVLQETVLARSRRDDDVGPKPSHLEATLRIQFPKPLEGRRRQQMD